MRHFGWAAACSPIKPAIASASSRRLASPSGDGVAAPRRPRRPLGRNACPDPDQQRARQDGRKTSADQSTNGFADRKLLAGATHRSAVSDPLFQAGKRIPLGEIRKSTAWSPTKTRRVRRRAPIRGRNFTTSSCALGILKLIHQDMPQLVIEPQVQIGRCVGRPRAHRRHGHGREVHRPPVTKHMFQLRRCRGQHQGDPRTVHCSSS